jgi:hypothetical protein
MYSRLQCLSVQYRNNTNHDRLWDDTVPADNATSVELTLEAAKLYSRLMLYLASV